MNAIAGGVKRRPYEAFGAMLKRAMGSAGRNNVWLARQLGVTPSMISRYREGDEAPDNIKLAVIVHVLSLDLEAACRVADRDPRAVEAVAVIASPGVPVGALLEFADGALDAALETIMAGNPARAQMEAAMLAGILGAAAQHERELAREIKRRQAAAINLVLGTLRETEITERAPERAIDLAPRALVTKSVPLIDALHGLGEEARSAAIVAQAHLAAGHMHYVDRDSVKALREFRKALAYEALISDDNLLVALRTMALAAGYLVARAYPGGGRLLPPWARQHVEGIAGWTRRIRRRTADGRYATEHAAMTALEGAGRACGMVGLDAWFADALSEAEAMNRQMEQAGAEYPLPRVQRIYARLTVLRLRNEQKDFDQVMCEARATVHAAQYPRHRQQIEDIDREWPAYVKGRGISARAKAAR